MKMKFIIPFAFLLLAAPAFADTVGVDNYDDFNAALSSAAVTPPLTIQLLDNISVSSALNSQGSTDLIIDGGGFFIDGSGLGTFFGVETGQSLSFVNVQIQNFSNLLSSDTFAAGGAVFSSGTVNITSSTFSSNTLTAINIDSAAYAYGGAIWSSGDVNIEFSTFSANSVYSGASGSADADAWAYGGAVYIESGSLSNVTLSSDVFSDNFTKAEILDPASGNAYAAGGAVYYAADSSTVMNVSDTYFTGNYAYSSGVNGATAHGGAIDNEASVVNIENSVFLLNSVNAVSPIAQTDSGGGAIYNLGILNVLNSSFFGNSASNTGIGFAQGGAIFNGGTLNITADGADAEFTGNTVNGASNALYNSGTSSVINMNAASGNQILMNDAITGSGGTININMTSGAAPVNGTVVFNNSVTGNDINLYNSGTLYLGVYDGVDNEDYSAPASRGSIGTASGRNNFSISDNAVLDMANGKADDVLYVNDFTVNGTPKIKIDADLANLASDKIDISGVTLGSGTLDFSGVNILSDLSGMVSSDISVFVSSPSVDYLAGTDFYSYRYQTNGSSSVYHVTEGADSGSLNFFLARYTDDPFQDAILQSGNRALSFEANYFVPGEFNPVMSTGTFILTGAAGLTIDGNAFSNIFVLTSSETELQVSDVSIENGKAEEGGAIFNDGGIVTLQNVVLSSNVAVSTDAAYGGAIYNGTGSVLNVYDSVLEGNSVSGADGSGGGAIYNQGIVNIIADSSDSEFGSNTVNGAANAIYNDGGAKLNLNAGSGKIIFNDPVASGGNDNIININASQSDDASVVSGAPVSGTVVLNADMTGFGNVNGSSGNTVNFYSGTIALGSDALFFDNVKFNMYAGATLDMVNGKIDNIAVNDFNLPSSGAAFVNIEADLRNAKADNFIGSVLTGNTGTLQINRIVLLNDVANLGKNVTIEIADDNNMKNAITLADSQSKVSGPIFIYDVSYNDGALTFGYTGDYNPGIFIAPVTMLIGGYLGQVNSYEQAFSGLYLSEEENGKKGLWVRPYGYNEKVELNNGLTVSNLAYGAYVGYDTVPTGIGRYDLNFSIYGAYTGAHQEYKEVNKIDENGGLVGFTAAVRRDSLFAALTANAGVISQHGVGETSKDDFMMFTNGIALKAGYDYAINEKGLRLQPSMTLSYSSIGMTPYSDNNGVKVDVRDVTPIQVNPDVKLISELPNDWQAYANVGAVWNFLSATKSYADDVELPEFSLKPYVQYGVGVYKSFGEVFSAGAEVFGRTIGRTGAGGKINLNWKL